VPIEISLRHGPSALRAAGALADLYRAAFCGPPWNEDESRVARFVSRLEGDVDRPGFVAAVARMDGRPVGFGTAWRTPAPFPQDRRYGDVTAQLGGEWVSEWLVGAQEIDELAVSPAAQRRGIGPRILEILTGLGTPAGTWLLTSTKSPVTVPFYRKCGWRQVTEDGTEIVVFLSPQHPYCFAGGRWPGQRRSEKEEISDVAPTGDHTQGPDRGGVQASR